MTIKTITLVLFSPDEAAWLAPAGAELARQLDAHLIGVHPVEPAVVYSAGMDVMVVPEVQNWHQEEDAQIEKAFSEAVRRAGIAGEYRSQRDGRLADEAYLLSCLRGVDLVALGTADPKEEPASAARMRSQAIRQSGRPTLVLPREVSPALPAKRVLIGWSDTRESARAAHDVLTLTEAGAAIDLLAVSRDAYSSSHLAGSRDDFAAALDRRGYSATLVDRDAKSSEIGKALLSAAAESDAQLVATGAFGHSQFYDFVIGAVTSHLLENARVPVLLSK
ncbi:universal stress protein [Celeribacter indicus]|uniref:Universal stress protein n=1 Tax=Celeribacter indicus TaxID=1208324 RepID=A0A0B5DPZ2_9RHOB|nr:universal stress protein [Celeribacter indicus]AJE45184.1 universal stress protein [Celeribacter indicus]SDX59290.1 Universal stress protein family protein [Celeribacter indicus]